jgi:hypothetical protein
MYSVHDIFTGAGETSELNALREVVHLLLYPANPKVVVLDDEARKRALQKQMERQHASRYNLGTNLAPAS